jgi:hypothetical protein
VYCRSTGPDREHERRGASIAGEDEKYRGSEHRGRLAGGRQEIG